MRIMFWNIQSGNPLSADESGKGQTLAKSAIGSGADVLVFCEVTNEALDCNDFLTLLRDAAAEEINKQVEWAKADVREKMQPKLTPAIRKKYKKGVDRLKLKSGRGRNVVRVGTRFDHLRTSPAAMRDVTSATDSVASSGVAAKFRQLRKVSAIQEQLKRAGIPEMMLDYDFNLGSEAIQNNRHYLVLSKMAFRHEYFDVNIASAKRQILVLNFGNILIPVIHAPSFGKGGGETAIQLTNYIADAAKPTVAIGDWNIDFEELIKEVEEENSNQPFHKLFSRKNVHPIPPPKRLMKTWHRRTWHPGRGDIEKELKETQKSGGTLDYAIAPDGLDVTVKIHVPPGRGSDHAAIIVDIDI